MCYHLYRLDRDDDDNDTDNEVRPDAPIALDTRTPTTAWMTTGSVLRHLHSTQAKLQHQRRGQRRQRRQ
jgi:hypothetical protein